MKDKNLKWGLLGLMIFSFTVLKGQDPQFSQFYNSSLYYNPATAGISRDLRFSSSYRKLWSKIPGDLSTYFISADYQLSESNVGIGFLM
jgi:type IX secretion system PorP/SprF family membrane protein